MEIEGIKIKKVFYKHFRYFNENLNGSLKYCNLKPYSRGKMRWTPACKGGETMCILLDENEREHFAYAKCSKKDAFVYKIGRTIALGRALKKMQDYYTEIPF